MGITVSAKHRGRDRFDSRGSDTCWVLEEPVQMQNHIGQASRPLVRACRDLVCRTFWIARLNVAFYATVASSQCKSSSQHSLLSRLTPCEYELTAVLQRITTEHAVQQPAGGVVFLLDGSGSVSQGECAHSLALPQDCLTRLSTLS